ncbi:LIC11966 family surface protein [Hymenobacter cellulosilyticus]|uniref:Uncharacterized protein n=1 Tax=Hymenobacter cellulosilyticus TaxID=2932248 RepID=A0A8T9Q0W6_9BACT|nr:hypothetical protein [Hymenobacter cellulosilyticus]UOQ71037.1 hypothetical protein MUN79_20535 [Hymenobacter cellulosilyticus]
MRISTLLLAGAFLTGISTTTVRAQAYTDPGAYNNAIVAEQLIMQKKCLRYISKSAHSENERKIEARRQDVVAQNKLSLAKISHMPGFQGNTEFRDRAKAALQQTLNVYSIDYQKVNTLAASRTKSLDAMQRYFDALEAAENKLEVAGDSVQAAQQRFATRFKMTMSEDRETRKMNDVIRQVSEVNSYQHKVFLAYFRLERANAKLTDGLNAQDAKAFEAARQQMEVETEKALAELDAVPAFRGKDTQYRDAARDYAKFYIIWTGNQFKKMTELLEQKDRLTKTDADAFNGYITAFNKQNHKLVEAYNNAGNTFQAAYIPVFND